MADFRELSTDPAIKAPGTAATAADNAMVVTMSPNSVGVQKLTDGTYIAALDSHGQLQISGAVLQQLMQLGVEQLRQLTKISLILASMSGVFIEDDDLDPITF